MTEWRKSEIYQVEASSDGQIRDIESKTLLVFDRRFSADSVMIKDKQIPAYLIIADAFLGPSPEKSHIHFKNGSRKNVIPEILEYRPGELNFLRG